MLWTSILVSSVHEQGSSSVNLRLSHSAMQAGLKDHLPDHKWLFVDGSTYLDTKVAGTATWRAFFLQLGLTDFLYVRPVARVLNSSGHSQSIWAKDDLGPRIAEREWVVLVRAALQLVSSPSGSA